ncbi:hypothetical protein BK004_04150 [bacterium CG10_46_32]|nr:MAG: hypothetical protein BK004_04150 [bacterium CG10_46_32]PIR55811.1 MAG: hypothetical protein COU73_04190 [Parcubacteria group bacterium CG10_big_fil_rev_8_21_14_0_10_46_32]
MVDILKSKETPKITNESVEHVLAPQPEIREPEPRREEQEARTGRSKEKPQASQLPSVSQHIRPLTERVPTPATKSERLIDIEKIMSEGLGEIFVSLPPEVKATVKYEGELAAHKIEMLIERSASIGKTVLSILRAWLSKIPGVNKFFLEQESKRKTDKIIAIAIKTRGE